MSQFGFLLPEWPDIHGAATRAETLALSDPRAAAFYTRRTLELVVAWLYRFDRRLKLPYQDNLSALIHEPSFRAVAGDAVFFKARLLKDIGNKAVHSEGEFGLPEARGAVKDLFHIAFWLVRSYAKGAKPADTLRFEPAKLPPPMAQIAKLTLTQLRKREEELRERDAALLAKDEQLAAAAADRAALDAELRRLQDEVAAAPHCQRRQAGHARLRRGRHPRPLHRPAAARSRLEPRCARHHGGRGFGHARRHRQGLRRLRAVGRRRPATGAGGGQTHPPVRA